MKIDTHQHYWHYQPEDFPWISDAMPALQRDCLPADNADELRATGIDAVIAVQARCLAVETDVLLQIARRQRQVCGVIGWADLSADDLALRLDQWGHFEAFKGLRHILQDEPDVAAWVAQSAVNDNLALLQSRQLIYEVLVFERQLPEVVNFCARHDRHWLVLDHVAKPALGRWQGDVSQAGAWKRGLRELAAMPHVLCKLSGLVTETDWSAGQGIRRMDQALITHCFDAALEAFGPQRLLFGSDWPVCQLAAPYAQVHQLAAHWAADRLSDAEQEAFWAGNAMRCYQLAAIKEAPASQES